MTYNVATNAFINYVTETSGDPNSRYSFLYAPAFNNNNRLAAQANINLQPATYKELRVWNADGTSTLVASGDSTTGPVFFAMDNSISMNNLDQVAFTTRTSTAASTRRIVVSDGTTTTMFPTVSDGAGFTSIDFFAPSINDTGLVAFRGNDNQATPRDSVFVTDGVTFQRIAGVNDTLMTDVGPQVVAFLMGGVSLNNGGDVAFGVQFTGGGNAIYVAYQTGGPTPTPTATPSATPNGYADSHSYGHANSYTKPRPHSLTPPPQTPTPSATATANGYRDGDDRTHANPRHYSSTHADRNAVRYSVAGRQSLDPDAGSNRRQCRHRRVHHHGKRSQACATPRHRTFPRPARRSRCAGRSGNGAARARRLCHDHQ